MNKRQRSNKQRCGEKMAYPTIVGAREHVERLIASGKDDAPERLTPYLCRWCFKFHVGHVREGRVRR